MKAILLTVLIILPLSCFSQWYLGAKAGTTFSNYKSRSKNSWKEAANAGFAFGVTAFKHVNDNVGYTIDLLYIQKGYYHKACNSISDQLEATYIEIPLTVDYRFIIPRLNNFKGQLSLGFYSAYWLTAKYKMKGFDADSEDFDFSDNKANRFDLGPKVGGKIEYLIPKNWSSLGLEVSYERGILDLQHQSQDDTKNTNRTFIINLSYTRPL